MNPIRQGRERYYEIQKQTGSPGKIYAGTVPAAVRRYDKKTKTLTFSGKGVVTRDSRKGNEIICEYECWGREIKRVVFKKGIKGIENLETDIVNAEEIIMADSITKIGGSAIMSSSNCRKIRFSKNLREVGHLSIDCSSCQEVILPDSIVKMDWRHLRRLPSRRLRCRKM